VKRNVFILLLFCIYSLNSLNALSVTSSANNLLCGTTPITFTFDCAFTGTVLFTSSSAPSISYSIMPGTLQTVNNGVIAFDLTVGASSAPASVVVNFLVISSNMTGCADPQDLMMNESDFANTTINFNCVLPPHDICTGAISLSIATGSCTATPFETLNTTISPISPSCAFSGWVDLWYTFVANNSTITLEMIDAPGILGIYSLYDGTGGCGSLGTPIACGNIVPTPGTQIFTNLNANAVYYLQIIFNPAGNGTAQQICLHSTTPQPPPCPDMVMLTGAESGMVDTESMDWIKSDQLLLPSSVVDYDATDSIVLLPNFEVQLGSLFHAFIDGCGGSMLKEEVKVTKKK